MIWSIGEWNDKRMKLDEDRRAIVDGYQLVDGIFTVYYEYLGNWADTTVCVSNGHFEANTENLIQDAVRSAGYWGNFIEGFHFMEDGRIEVVIGS